MLALQSDMIIIEEFKYDIIYHHIIVSKIHSRLAYLHKCAKGRSRSHHL